jgi:hypothetical protein
MLTFGTTPVRGSSPRSIGVAAIVRVQASSVPGEESRPIIGDALYDGGLLFLADSLRYSRERDAYNSIIDRLEQRMLERGVPALTGQRFAHLS